MERVGMEFSAARSRFLCEKLKPVFRGSCSIRVPAEIIHDPDPAIYDQQLSFLEGGSPTFNSPDIDTVDVWPLRPIDSLRISCRNLSATSSANQTRIDLSWSPWGIGMQRQAIGSSYVDLGRAGFPGSEATISWPLPPVVKAAGRYGIFVKLFHPYDTDTSNNQGEQTADGFQTSGGRSRTFVVPVRNPTAVTQTVVLLVGPPPVAPWVNVVPSVITLAAGAQQNVMVSIDVPSAIPASPAGTLISAAVDVLATIGGAYLGGVSILILFDA